jgi:hypothetical protein
MDIEFVTYEQALALKELGFDERCLIKSEHTKKCMEKERPGGCQLHNLHCGYPDCTIDKTITPIPLPLKQQVFRWFRENHNWIGGVRMLSGGSNYLVGEFYKDEDNSFMRFRGTYEEIENDCINELIDRVKEQNNG